MGKNKKNKFDVENIKGSIVGAVTNSLNKHGEIRGETKKETKNLKAMCPHHKITKKGKIKPTIFNDGQGTCTCEMCGAKFTTHLYNKEESDKIIGKMKGMLDQARFMNQAADTGKETQIYLAKLSVDVSHFGKTYGRIKKAVERTDSIKKKKNKSNNHYNGSSYGSWKSWKS